MAEYMGLTPEEEEQERKRREREAEIAAPFKALRKRMDAGLRYAIVSGGVTDDEILEMTDAVPEWQAGIKIAAGETVKYMDAVYVCVQAHTTQTGWEPGTATLALFRRVQSETSDEWQPDTDYAVGDIAVYEGVPYKCIQAHTSLPGWEPPNVPALWTLNNAE